MKSVAAITAAFVTASFLVFAFWTTSPTSAQPPELKPIQAWEFHYYDGNLQSAHPSQSDVEEIKHLGAKGWELVAVARGETNQGTIYYFKRPTQNRQ
jgi:hypothetical protein